MEGPTTTTNLGEPPAMSNRELSAFRDLIYEECGISLNDSKKTMVSARLNKRLRTLGFSTYSQYYDYVCSPVGRKREHSHMIDAITTNTTEFFRERKHFDYLAANVLPALTKRDRFRKNKRIDIWSAGCSSGEEPYTLAMVLSDFFRTVEGTFQIYATDISTKVLDKAKMAIYGEDAIKPVPPPMRHNYLMQGSGSKLGYYRVVPELRERISFSYLNFMDLQFTVPAPVDIIFCRNVIIYFDFETKSNLINRFYDHLVPGGYYFAGHSETLSGFNSHFVAVAPTVYAKPL